MLTLRAAGVGLSVMSEPMTNAHVPGIVFRKVEGVSRTFELALVYRRNEAAPAVKAFIEFMRGAREARAGLSCRANMAKVSPPVEFGRRGVVNVAVRQRVAVMRTAVKTGAIGQVAAALERRLERGENLRFAEAVVFAMAAIDFAFHAIDQAMRRAAQR